METQSLKRIKILATTNMTEQELYHSQAKSCCTLNPCSCVCHVKQEKDEWEEELQILHKNHRLIRDIQKQSYSDGFEEGRRHRDDIPMGASQWLNHGEKYGYDKYFRQQGAEVPN